MKAYKLFSSIDSMYLKKNITFEHVFFDKIHVHLKEEMN